MSGKAKPNQNKNRGLNLPLAEFSRDRAGACTIMIKENIKKYITACSFMLRAKHDSNPAKSILSDARLFERIRK
jgi:hypothetical protein